MTPMHAHHSSGPGIGLGHVSSSIMQPAVYFLPTAALFYTINRERAAHVLHVVVLVSSSVPPLGLFEPIEPLDLRERVPQWL